METAPTQLRQVLSELLRGRTRFAGKVTAVVGFPDARKLLLTLHRDGIPPELPDDVVAKPAYIWALE